MHNCPQKSQIVASPFFASRFCISYRSVTRIRQPEAPTGCPRAMAPPFTFKMSGLNPSSLATATDCAAKTEDITSARLLAAGGRGMGGPEGFDALRRIAELLGGTIACSRASVEILLPQLILALEEYQNS